MQTVGWAGLVLVAAIAAAGCALGATEVRTEAVREIAPSVPAITLTPPVPEVSPSPAPTRLVPLPVRQRPAPEPAVRLVIEKIGVDSEVIELGMRLLNGEWQWDVPDHVVGHYLGTANPGERGNMVMAGHISSPGNRMGAVFARLGDLQPGDEVIAYTNVTQFLYEVKETHIVPPTDTRWMDDSVEPVLTLITCWPDRIYSHRLVVRAVLKQQAPEVLASTDHGS